MSDSNGGGAFRVLRFRFRARVGREARTAYCCVGMGGRSGDGWDGIDAGVPSRPGRRTWRTSRRISFESPAGSSAVRSACPVAGEAWRPRATPPSANGARARAGASDAGGSRARPGPARSDARERHAEYARRRASFANPSRSAVGTASARRAPAASTAARSPRRAAPDMTRDARIAPPGSRDARVLQQNRPSRRSSAPRDRDGRGAESPERARERRDRRSARGSRDSAGASARRGTRAPGRVRADPTRLRTTLPSCPSATRFGDFPAFNLCRAQNCSLRAPCVTDDSPAAKIIRGLLLFLVYTR